MRPKDETLSSQSEEISLELDLRHAPEKVWRALTEPELLTRWLLPVVDAEFEPGATFVFRAPPQPEWDGVVHCRVIDVDAPTSLSYAWVVGDLDTRVTFTLEPTDSGTRLSIVHSGFGPQQKRNLAGARYGWKMMTGRLVEVLDGGAEATP